MRKRINENTVMKFLVLLLAALMVMIPISWERTFAATSSVSISDGSPDVGDSFTVTVYYSGDSFGSVDGALTYDASILRFEDCTCQSNGGNGEISFSNYQTSGEESMAITFYFTVIGAGSSNVTAYSSDIYNYDGNSLGSDVASASFTVTGTGQTTSDEDDKDKSTNADLSHLSIACGALKPAFSPDVTSYTVTASATETNADITAIPVDDDADVDFSGSPEFTQDEVTRTVTVTAADGKTKKQYSIKITRSNPSGAIIYNGTAYVPSENQNFAEVPASFLASKINYNGRDLNILKSRDGNVNLIRLMPEGGSDSSASWFVFNPETNTFLPSEIVNIDGNKYVVIRSGVNLVYGGSESASGYQIYDPNTGSISAINMGGSGSATVQPEEPSTEPAPEGTTPAESETPAPEKAKKGKGLLWFLLLLLLALAALLYMLFRDKFSKKRNTYLFEEDEEADDESNSSVGNKMILTLAGLKDNLSSKIKNDGGSNEEAGMSERRLERRRRIAEAEARAAENIESESYTTYPDSVFDDILTDSTPIAEGSVVTKAELEAAKIAAAEKAREEAERAAEEAKAAREAAAAALAARDAARAAKARVASSELNSAMEELLEAGEELNEAVNKKDE